MTDPPADYLDLARWPRRAAFEYFRRFDKPSFSVCTRIDVQRIAEAAHGRGSTMLACHYLGLAAAQQLEPLRLRIEGDRVRLHPRVDGSTVVLCDDRTIGFATLPFLPDFAAFAASARAAIARVRRDGTSFDGADQDTALVYFTTVPWVHFTSFSAARRSSRDESIPKIAFGRIDRDGPRAWMPMSVEVHHALMDGLHVGQFVEWFEAAAREPQRWLHAPLTPARPDSGR